MCNHDTQHYRLARKRKVTTYRRLFTTYQCTSVYNVNKDNNPLDMQKSVFLYFGEEKVPDQSVLLSLVAVIYS